jgi:hypothetical protein
MELTKEQSKPKIKNSCSKKAVQKSVKQLMAGNLGWNS